MSIESLDAAIAAKRIEFNSLNQERYDPILPYVALSEKTEQAICELAEEIARLELTKTVMLVSATIEL